MFNKSINLIRRWNREKFYFSNQSFQILLISSVEVMKTYTISTHYLYSYFLLGQKITGTYDVNSTTVTKDIIINNRYYFSCDNVLVHVIVIQCNSLWKHSIAFCKQKNFNIFPINQHLSNIKAISNDFPPN